MPSDILTRARALLEGITPGKWNYELTEYEAEVYRNNVDYNDKIASVYGEDGKQQCKNTFFIVAAPELVRELCAEVEGLERSLARRTMERDNVTERWDKENDMRHTAEARAEQAERERNVLFRSIYNNGADYGCFSCPAKEECPVFENCNDEDDALSCRCHIDNWSAQEAEKEGGD